MKVLKNLTILQLATSLALIITSLSVAYYFVYYLPTKERVEQTRKVKQEKSQAEIHNDCEQEAKDKSTKLLKDKVEILEESNQTYSQEYTLWKEAVEKGLVLKEDYNDYYELCLKRHGLE